jgi:hypothetical protein
MADKLTPFRTTMIAPQLGEVTIGEKAKNYVPTDRSPPAASQTSSNPEGTQTSFDLNGDGKFGDGDLSRLDTFDGSEHQRLKSRTWVVQEGTNSYVAGDSNFDRKVDCVSWTEQDGTRVVLRDTNYDGKVDYEATFNEDKATYKIDTDYDGKPDPMKP